MRIRFQNPKGQKRGRSWIGQWWEDGHRRKRTLGRIAQMSKAEAQAELGKILAPLNARQIPPSQSWLFTEFVDRIYLPFYRHKWKRSTVMTTEDRIQNHLVTELGTCTLGSFKRDDLQNLLNRKAADDFSFSMVDHLRWDVRQIFEMAVDEGFFASQPGSAALYAKGMPAGFNAHHDNRPSKTIIGGA